MTAIDYAALVDRARKSIIKCIPSSRVDVLLGELAGALERLTQPVGVEPVAYVVFDEDGPGFCAGWEAACHEHINDAIIEHDITEAAKWRVVAVSPTADLARLIAERDAAQRDADRYRWLCEGGGSRDYAICQYMPDEDSDWFALGIKPSHIDATIDAAMARSHTKVKP